VHKGHSICADVITCTTLPNTCWSVPGHTNLYYNLQYLEFVWPGLVWSGSHCRPLGRGSIYNLLLSSFLCTTPLVVFSVASLTCPSSELCSWECFSGVVFLGLHLPKTQECLVYEIDLAIQSWNSRASLAQLTCCRPSAHVLDRSRRASRPTAVSIS
jgi:hypothetical protein